MILSVKSHLSIDKLKSLEFFSDYMEYYMSVPELMWHYFITPSSFYSEKLVGKLQNDNNILDFSFDFEGVEPKMSASSPYNDNFYNQWAFRNTGQFAGFPGEDSRILQAWETERGSFDIVVAVIDSGVDVDHECLVGHIYIDTREVDNIGVDSDGNGLKNDFIGWNCETNQFKSYTSSHGTAVASVITTNGYGMSGVCQKARIMPVAIGDIDQYDIPEIAMGYPCGCPNACQTWEDEYESVYSGIPSSRVTAAIVYAAKKGAHILNISYSRRYSRHVGICVTYPMATYMPDVRDAIKFAGKYGCIVVTAAGDWQPEDQKVFPAAAQGNGLYVERTKDDPIEIWTDRNCLPGAYTMYFNHMLNVTAHDNWGYLYSEKVLTQSSPAEYNGYLKGCLYSKSTVDIAAPGKNIVIAKPNNTYGIGGGTSLAAGYVSGAAALIWSKNPALKNTDVVNIIMGTARRTNYWSTRVKCSGMLDIERAVLAA